MLSLDDALCTRLRTARAVPCHFVSREIPHQSRPITAGAHESCCSGKEKCMLVFRAFRRQNFWYKVEHVSQPTRRLARLRSSEHAQQSPMSSVDSCCLGAHSEPVYSPYCFSARLLIGILPKHDLRKQFTRQFSRACPAGPKRGAASTTHTVRQRSLQDSKEMSSMPSTSKTGDDSDRRFNVVGDCFKFKLLRHLDTALKVPPPQNETRL